VATLLVGDTPLAGVAAKRTAGNTLNPLIIIENTDLFNNDIGNNPSKNPRMRV
jgi:hypothetical protein